MPDQTMCVNASLREVSLAAVDLADRSLAVTAGRDTRALERSIARCGLLNPLLLAPRQHGTGYRVVCGVLRAQALAALGRTTCTARVAGSDVPESLLLLVALSDNAAHRRCNAVEKARAAALLMAHYPESEAVRLCAELTGVPPTMTACRQYRDLAAADARLHELLLAEQVTIDTAFALCAMTHEDRACFMRLFSIARFSARKQDEIVEMCADISRRDAVPLRHALEHPDVRHCMEAPSAGNAAQTAEQVRRCLRLQRFPRLAQRERKVQETIRRLRMPAGITLEPPPYFEGGRWRCVVQVAAPGDVRAAAGELALLAGRAELAELLRE